MFELVWLLFEEATAVAIIVIVFAALVVHWLIEAARGVREAFEQTRHLRR